MAHQVVLFSPGLDTRPFRLPWPKGTVIYDVASKDVHALRKERIKKRAPRGCLHIPVNLQVPSVLDDHTETDRVVLKGIHNLQTQMERIGFRGDRLSVWAIQVFCLPTHPDLDCTLCRDCIWLISMSNR